MSFTYVHVKNLSQILFLEDHNVIYWLANFPHRSIITSEYDPHKVLDTFDENLSHFLFSRHPRHNAMIAMLFSHISNYWMVRSVSHWGYYSCDSVTRYAYEINAVTALNDSYILYRSSSTKRRLGSFTVQLFQELLMSYWSWSTGKIGSFDAN